jgi:Arc/MetJ-type ribon-helix-helix transcriptional regulator
MVAQQVAQLAQNLAAESLGRSEVEHLTETESAGIGAAIERDSGANHPSHRVVAGRGHQWGGFRWRRRTGGMVNGMVTKKVTVTLEEGQLDRIRALVSAGTTSSVSGFVQHAVGNALDDVAGWGAMLADALQDSGGELSREERSWADEVLGVKKRSTSSAA